MNLDHPGIKALLAGSNDHALFQEAFETRAQHFENQVHLRGIIELSNVCARDCAYCGIRRSNRSLQRYRLPPAEVISLAVLAHHLKKGLNTIVLQSGEDDFYKAEDIADIVRGIKDRVSVDVTLSLGEHDPEVYRMWREAGADRYLMKIETFNRENYQKMRPGCDFEKRLELLGRLQGLGYETGSGIIIGLPGEGIDDLADSLLRLSELKLDMLGCGPFIPHPGTPLSDELGGDYQTTLRYTALLRILNPLANIPATTALVTVRPEGRVEGLKAGANVIMPSLTPARNRRLYEIYPGKNIDCDCVLDNLDGIIAEIEAAGFRISEGTGKSKVVHQGSIEK
ncbi:MAG: [FeFe] hydrogenase H-cluster radical SAM maturase HydE [Candidatus Wallbacteria bacterium]|nr:[FeFe] hydrogenase H-cluster radical SAM maturase HydE [Candidatus Wallbacteria bacterium]